MVHTIHALPGRNFAGPVGKLLNFQTMVTDLTGLPIANASCCDEATSAAEAMAMVFHHVNKTDVISKPNLFVDDNIFPQTKMYWLHAQNPIGIELVYGDL